MNPPGVVEVHIMLLPEAKLRHTFFSLCLGLENPGSSFHEFLFPLLDLIRMNLIFSRDLGDGQFPHSASNATTLNLESYGFFIKCPSFPGQFNGHFTPSQVVQFSGPTAQSQ